MTRTEAGLLTVTAVLLVAWLMAGRGPGHVSEPAARSPAASGRSEELRIDGLRDRTRRLGASLATPRPFRPVARNPFAFGRPARTDSTRSLVAAETSVVDERPARPPMALSGIAEEVENGTPSRTAIIASGGQLFLAREGDRILSRFLVLRISADAVQLRDEERGDVFGLALKQGLIASRPPDI